MAGNGAEVVCSPQRTLRACVSGRWKIGYCFFKDADGDDCRVKVACPGGFSQSLSRPTHLNTYLIFTSTCSRVSAGETLYGKRQKQHLQPRLPNTEASERVLTPPLLTKETDRTSHRTTMTRIIPAAS